MYNTRLQRNSVVLNRTDLCSHCQVSPWRVLLQSLAYFMAGKQDWVAGGELTSSDKSPQDFKQIILDILQEGETVTRCVSSQSTAASCKSVTDHISKVCKKPSFCKTSLVWFYSGMLEIQGSEALEATCQEDCKQAED